MRPASGAPAGCSCLGRNGATAGAAAGSGLVAVSAAVEVVLPPAVGAVGSAELAGRACWPPLVLRLRALVESKPVVPAPNAGWKPKFGSWPKRVGAPSPP